jgi:hypothetical protein
MVRPKHRSLLDAIGRAPSFEEVFNEMAAVVSQIKEKLAAASVVVVDKEGQYLCGEGEPYGLSFDAQASLVEEALATKTVVLRSGETGGVVAYSADAKHAWVVFLAGRASLSEDECRQLEDAARQTATRLAQAAAKRPVVRGAS